MTTLHVVSILDCSGSMAGSQSEVIGAYNAFVAESEKLGSTPRRASVLFAA